MGPFKHLIRFRNTSSQTFYGELDTVNNADETLIGRQVRVFTGDDLWDNSFRMADREEEITEVSHTNS